MKKEDVSLRKAYIAWLSLSLFYFFQYMLRVSTGVMELPIRESLGLTADQFGTLGSYYLYVYGGLQIPLGILIDRIGIKRTAMISILLCCLGTYFMYIANTLGTAQMSRMLIGAGSACAFMSAMKIAADFLPPGQRGLMMGLTLSIGTLGAITAGKPLIILSDIYTWRLAMLMMIPLGLISLLLVWVFVPRSRKPLPNEFPMHKEAIFPVFKAEFLKIINNKNILIYSFLTVGLYAPLSALADLWGTAYLTQKFMLSRGDAAQLSMFLYIGLTLGAFSIPWFFEKLNKINLGVQVSCFMVIIGFCLLLYLPSIPMLWLVAVLFFIGYISSGEMLCFTGALFYSNENNSGLTIGFVNMINMLGGAVLQQFIGIALDMSWDNTFTETGLRAYTTGDFTVALSVIMVLLVMCQLSALKLKKL